jgi:tRNA pseudouridine32 synthase/23S rRNA pseudouridine746 synthase
MKEMHVIHEEPEFVVVVKPSGLLSVPGRGPENLDCVSERVKVLYPGCIEQPSVHRLDMDTSGLLVVARTKEVHRNISIQFQEHEVNKRYIAILDGELDGEEGIIELPFRLDINNRPHQIYDPVHGKVGITHLDIKGQSEYHVEDALVRGRQLTRIVTRNLASRRNR